MILFLKGIGSKFLNFAKWVAASCIVGAVIGPVGAAFYYGLELATEFRTERPGVILGLPLAGLVIVFLYHIAGKDNDRGTNSVLSAIRSEERLTIAAAPLIFISTILTHLFGGSAGREGAALQVGGSIGNGFGRLFGMDEADRHVMIMCGMSACFAAVFGTPMAAAVFSMEVVSVGIMYYSALVPCVLASLVASGIAHALGTVAERMPVFDVPEFTWVNGGKTIVLAFFCALLSVLFCVTLHAAEALGKKWIKNRYLRIALAGLLIVLLAALFGTGDYLGAGMNIIEKCMEGEAVPGAFLVKILFTAITLGAGFKGGEIVPCFFVGATFGCMMGGVMGLPGSLCAAVGMAALFCGVTNCPITALLISLEVFGMEGFPYFLAGTAVSYMLSGYQSLYHTQKIIYSKYKAEYIGKKAE